MNTIYTIAKDARDKRGFTHLQDAAGTLTDLSTLADRKVRHPSPSGWAYVDRACGVTATHYNRKGESQGYYKLVSK
jgi:hypothetical protein